VHRVGIVDLPHSSAAAMSYECATIVVRARHRHTNLPRPALRVGLGHATNAGRVLEHGRDHGGGAPKIIMPGATISAAVHRRITLVMDALPNCRRYKLHIGSRRSKRRRKK
jgi:hypothetical protein